MSQRESGYERKERDLYETHDDDGVRAVLDHLSMDLAAASLKGTPTRRQGPAERGVSDGLELEPLDLPNKKYSETQLG